MRRAVRLLAISALTAVICIGGYRVWEISGQYTDEKEVRSEMLKYRLLMEEPKPQEPQAPAVYTGGSGDVEYPPEEPRYNQSVIDMQNQINRDIAGWLTIPDTRIDYPFAAPSDNEYYLRRDIHGNKASAGSLFMDFRCADDFSGLNTIIYGHNMKNKSMFGDLSLFAEQGFFEENTSGTIFLADQTLTLDIFAYMVIRDDDGIIYGLTAERDEFMSYVRASARSFREPKTLGNIVTLSTCSYQSDQARAVLLAMAA